jgi:hypothetical protein
MQKIPKTNYQPKLTNYNSITLWKVETKILPKVVLTMSYQSHMLLARHWTADPNFFEVEVRLFLVPESHRSMFA